MARVEDLANTPAKRSARNNEQTKNNHLSRDARVYRVQGVPLDWDVDQLHSFLTQKAESGTPSVRSLANEVHGRSQAATVSFDKPRNRGPRWYMPLSDQPGQPCLALDNDFFGLTTLYAPLPQNHKIE